MRRPALRTTRASSGSNTPNRTACSPLTYCEKPTHRQSSSSPASNAALHRRLTVVCVCDRTNLDRSGVTHEHDQPAHLRIKSDLAHVPKEISMQTYAAPETRFCPARVYEYKECEETGAPELVINAQNCVHCKCCSIKMPQEYIRWTVPEGGGGPGYTMM